MQSHPLALFSPPFVELLVRALMSCFILLVASQAAAQTSEQRFGYLGRCELTSGKFIEDCTVGYRTYGQLNADRSNTVVLLSWFNGTAGDWRAMVGPARFWDMPDKYFVIIDALGNGVSSSPSNSRKQPGTRFPEISVTDMVNSQYRLLTEIIGVDHVGVVTGVSLGGIQAFQWAVSYPDFMDDIIAVVGTPRAQSQDVWPWRYEVEGCPFELSDVKGLLLHPLSFPSIDRRSHGDDRRLQLRAVLKHDVAPGLTMQDLAPLIHARMLIIVGIHDHLLAPNLSLELGEAMGAAVLTLRGFCGHMAAMICEQATTAAAIRTFVH